MSIDKKFLDKSRNQFSSNQISSNLDLQSSSWIVPSNRKDGSLVTSTRKDGSLEQLESADDSGKYIFSQKRQTAADMTVTNSGGSSKSKMRKIKSCLFQNEYGAPSDGGKNLKDYDNYIQLNVGKHYRKESDDRNRKNVPAPDKNDALFKKLLPETLRKSHTVMFDAEAVSPEMYSSGDEKKYNFRRVSSPSPKGYQTPRNQNRSITPANHNITFSSITQVNTSPETGSSGLEINKPGLGADWVNMTSSDNGALLQYTKSPKKVTPPRQFKNNLSLLNIVEYKPTVGGERRGSGT
jgi:hypothetical protein